MKKVGVGSLVLGAGAAGVRTAQAAEHKWKMVTTWPKNFPGLGTGANRLAELIGEMSGGFLRTGRIGTLCRWQDQAGAVAYPGTPPPRPRLMPRTSWRCEYLFHARESTLLETCVP
jgi:hypothetical protein